jgi:hypothetical protein
MIMNKIHYREIWSQHHGEIPKDELGRSYEIHHIDGNHQNDEISNLQVVSITEHYDIHYQRGDFGACQLIATRISEYLTPEEKSKLMILENKRRIEEGTHNWLGKNNYRHERIANGTDHMMGEGNPAHKRVEDGTHNFLGEMSPNNTRVSCLCCKKEINLPTFFAIHNDKCNRGRNIYRLDPTIYTFQNKHTGQVVAMTQSDLIFTFSLTQSNLNAVVRGKKKSCSGWRLV